MPGWLAIVLGLVGLVAGWVCNASRPTPQIAAAPPAVVQPAPPPVALAPAVAAARIDDGKLILEGSLPDVAARDALVRAARAAHPADSVVDRLVLDNRVGPLGALTLRGDVASEAARTKLVDGVRAALAGVRIDDQLRVPPAAAQEERIRAFLEGRHIEFALGSANLTQAGAAILDQLLPLVQADATTRIEIQGHTDNTGDPVWNRQLSEARAGATRAYLVRKGVAAERLTARGYGDARPVADNATVEGRSRNRRIEFDVEEK
jgi:OOP family OmpA-OmpF porin